MRYIEHIEQRGGRHVLTVPRTLLTNVAYFLVVFSRPVDIYRVREKNGWLLN